MYLQSDARKIPLSDRSVRGMVITSPPYNVGVEYDAWNDRMAPSSYWKFMEDWMCEVFRVLAPGSRIAVNVPNVGNSSDFVKKGKGIIAYMLLTISALNNTGFIVRDCITWFKTHATDESKIEQQFCGGNTAWGSWGSPSNPFCRSFSEFIVVAHKEKERLPWKAKPDITRDEFLLWTRNVWLMPTRNNPDHPASFPDELPRRLMKLYTYPGDTILDPFVGSGTTVRVAEANGRVGIGMDLSYEYLKCAQKELAILQSNFPLAQQIMRQVKRVPLNDLPLFKELDLA